jgi:lipopolysaccharide/colanic/teichoic acid biosynthesis glycosyltransferase
LEAQLFNRMLCIERQRSNRTGNPFVLLILDISGLTGGNDSIASEIGSAVQAGIRTTDICGWYAPSSLIGVIFTALQEIDKAAVRSAIENKVKQALLKIMPPESVETIALSFHFFPEESGKAVFTSDDKLYPDLKDATISRLLYRGLKRTIDVLGSIFLLALFLPLFAVFAALIKATSEGPVFFKQRRIGRFGLEFNCLKFRTMRANCDHELHRQYVQKLIQEKDVHQKVFKIVDDPRVTSVGKVLRKTSMDELPQFINVLLGEMSIVGPRPPIPYEIECYRSWHKRRIIEAKPGITGLWQVYGRSRTSFEDMVRLDIQYIEQQSLWLDLKLIILTPIAVFSGSGAY